MGKIHRLIKDAGRVERFYVECEDCGAVILDSAKTNIPAGQPEHAEAMADTAIRGHADQPDIIRVKGERKEINCDSFEVTIETAGEPRIDPTTDPDLDVDVTVQ